MVSGGVMVKSIRFVVVGILLLFSVHIMNSHREFDSKDLYYDHVRYSDNVDFYGVEGMNLHYSGNLSEVGDFYELFFDVVNQTGVDVVVQDSICHDSDSYIRYELSYEDGSIIQPGDLLKNGESETIHYKVFYQRPIQDDSYQLDSSFSIQFEQSL